MNGTESNPGKPLALPDLVTFLRSHFGAEFSFVDPELTRVSITARGIGRDELLSVLEFYGDAIVTKLRFGRERRLQCCVGGPMNGRHHRGYYLGQVLAYHLSRGRWAVYEVGDDNHRAFFLGLASSERNARRKIFKLNAESKHP